MSTHVHDPLCPMWSKVWAGNRCDCDLIAKVRAAEEDEWLNKYNAAEARGYRAGVTNSIAAIDDPEVWVGGRKAAIAAPRALLDGTS